MEARVDLRTAVELDPENHLAAYNLDVLLSDNQDDEDNVVLNDEEYEEKPSNVYYV